MGKGFFSREKNMQTSRGRLKLYSLIVSGLRKRSNMTKKVIKALLSIKKPSNIMGKFSSTRGAKKTNDAGD